VPVAAGQQGAVGQQGTAPMPAPAPVATAALAPASETSNDPKQLYETAYGYLLQRDYGAAETAFDEFLKKFPNDCCPATRSTGSARRISCAANTRRQQAPS
jgi:TolA-binding protein